MRYALTVIALLFLSYYILIADCVQGLKTKNTSSVFLARKGQRQPAKRGKERGIERGGRGKREKKRGGNERKMGKKWKK